MLQTVQRRPLRVLYDEKHARLNIGIERLVGCFCAEEVLYGVFVDCEIVEVLVGEYHLFLVLATPVLACGLLDVVKRCVLINLERGNEAAGVNHVQIEFFQDLLWTLALVSGACRVWTVIRLHFGDDITKVIVTFEQFLDEYEFDANSLNMDDWLCDTRENDCVASHLIDGLTKSELDDLLQQLNHVRIGVVLQRFPSSSNWVISLRCSTCHSSPDLVRLLLDISYQLTVELLLTLQVLLVALPRLDSF